jgi:hypothetical protein
LLSQQASLRDLGPSALWPIDSGGRDKGKISPAIVQINVQYCPHFDFMLNHPSILDASTEQIRVDLRKTALRATKEVESLCAG